MNAGAALSKNVCRSFHECSWAASFQKAWGNVLDAKCSRAPRSADGINNRASQRNRRHRYRFLEEFSWTNPLKAEIGVRQHHVRVQHFQDDSRAHHKDFLHLLALEIGESHQNVTVPIQIDARDKVDTTGASWQGLFITEAMQMRHIYTLQKVREFKHKELKDNQVKNTRPILFTLIYNIKYTHYICD